MDNQTITVDGLSFLVRVRGDDSCEMPWDREDGHGPVRRARANHTGYPDKRAGEKVLAYDFGRAGWVYDHAEAVKIALRDGWGIAQESRDRIEKVLGRPMTAGEVADRAVLADFKRLADFLADRWGYVGVVVCLLDVDGNPTQHGDSVWGIESDWEEGIADYAHDIARRMAANLKGRAFVSYGSTGRQRIRAAKSRKVRA